MATPSSKAKDPLDALQSLVNDVLVQTGKALRASRKDAQGHLTQAPEATQSKLPETIRSFHCALDELEYEILKAKSALLRDLNQVQERKKLLIKPDPQPVELQPKRPDPIGLDSPPIQTIKDEVIDADAAAPQALMAPFPNMSIDFPNPHQADVPMKGLDSQPLLQQPALPMSHNVSSDKLDPGMAPGLPGQMMVGGNTQMEMTNPPGLSNTSEMNFTDMEFSLAPPPPLPATAAADAAAANEPQAPTGTTDPAFDLATFAPSDGMNRMMPMNLPDQSNNVGPVLSDQSTAPNSNTQEKVEDHKGEAADSSKFHDLFGKDSGAADGMDFDFSLGGERDTFDDLMNDRDDGTFDMMIGGGGGGSGGVNTIVGAGTGTGTGDFDATFFGLEKTDET